MRVRWVCFTIVLVLALATGPVIRADEAELTLGKSAIRLTYAKAWNKAQFETSASWLHHKDNGNVFGLGGLATGLVGSGSKELELGLGGKLILADVFNDDGFAVALGTRARYAWPNVERLGLEGGLYVAPRVTSFSGAQGYFEVSLGATYRVLKQAVVYGGYRLIKVDLKSTTEDKVDNSLQVGMQFRF